jgi:DNA-binding CsgD family transcriptional regulator
LRLILFGKSLPDIAKLLGLGPETVRTHSKNAQAKLGARNQAQAVAEAMRRHMIA